MTRLLCLLGAHRWYASRTKTFAYFSAVVVIRRCSRAGCRAARSELWQRGRRL
jgi:hypothetical protein